jgi:hypothetical protein
MNMRNMLRWTVPSVMLACAGSVVATPGDVDVDGTSSGDPYGAQLVSQASRVIDEIVAGPISGSAQSNQSVPMGGEGVGNFLGSQLNGPTADVTTGLELSLNLQFLGWNGTDPINVAGFVVGTGIPTSDFLSNQVIGGVRPDNSGNLGAAGIDFTTMDGEQFVVADTTVGAAPTLDGTADIMGAESTYALSQSAPTDIASRVAWSQETFTQFGDNNNPDPVANSGGSEINNVRTYVSDPNNSLPTVDGDETLNIHVAGNIENNGNNFNLFIDVRSGGFDTGFQGGMVSNLGDLGANTLEIDADWGIQFNRGDEIGRAHV